jgi:lysozyme
MDYTGIALTEQFEGCSLTAYPDVKGVWTIGYGHTGGVQPGQTCTQEQADEWLQIDIQTAVRAVQTLVKVPLTQDEFNALCDFVFNIGSGNFAASTMLAKLNLGDYAGAAAQFQRWDLAGGNVIQGLLNRRIAEENEFNGQPDA